MEDSVDRFLEVEGSLWGHLRSDRWLRKIAPEKWEPENPTEAVLARFQEDQRMMDSIDLYQHIAKCHQETAVAMGIAAGPKVPRQMPEKTQVE